MTIFIQSLENLIIRNGFDTDKVVSFIKRSFHSLRIKYKTK